MLEYRYINEKGGRTCIKLLNVRTIYKDIEILACSYPIYTTQGNGGGIHIVDGFKLGMKYLTKEQAEFLESILHNYLDKEKEILVEILNISGCQKLRMGRNKYALKSFEFYNAINELGITINDIAVDMCIPIRILEEKLQKQEPFSKEHIRFLTYKFGATIMFHVIYFPDKKFRERVYRKVFLRGGGITMPNNC